MEKHDITIDCQGCAELFTWTVGEQEFYGRKGFTERPRRCKPCREARKAGQNLGHEDAQSVERRDRYAAQRRGDR